MANELIWKGFSTDGGIRIGVRVESAGTLTAVDGATTYTGDTITAGLLTSRDGIGIIDVGKPTKPTTFEIFLDSTSVGTVGVDPLPAAGDTWQFVAGGCYAYHYTPDNQMMVKIYDRTPRPVFFAALDDWSYPDSTTAAKAPGYTHVNIEDNSTQADFHQANHTFRRHYGVKTLHERLPVLWMPGDHGVGNNWDHTVAQANLGTNPTRVVTQQDVDDIYAIAKNTFLSWGRTNPRTSGTGDTDPFYGAWTIGDCRFVWIDTLSYKGWNHAVDDASKVMLGANQRTWMLNELNNATETWKFLLTSFRFQNVMPSSHSDSWELRTTDLDDLHANITADNVIALSCDQHVACVWSNGSLVDIGVGQMGHNSQVHDAGYPAGVVYKANGSAGLADGPRTFGVIEVVGTTKVRVKIVHAEHGGTLWGGEILAGSNTVTYPQVRLSV